MWTSRDTPNQCRVVNFGRKEKADQSRRSIFCLTTLDLRDKCDFAFTRQQFHMVKGDFPTTGPESESVIFYRLRLRIRLRQKIIDSDSGQNCRLRPAPTQTPQPCLEQFFFTSQKLPKAAFPPRQNYFFLAVHDIGQKLSALAKKHAKLISHASIWR